MTHATHADPRPAWRGRIHLGAAIVTPAMAATLITLAAARSGLAAVGVSVYCGLMLAMFATSALYHSRTWGRRAWDVLRRVDHAMIFLFIAATYLPLGLLAIEETRRWVILRIVMGACTAGAALKAIRPDAPRWATVPLYIAVGWVAVGGMGDIAHHAGVAALVLLVVGGVVYTAGAVAYGMRRPNPHPSFGFHEVFHLATVVAAVCQYIAVFLAVYGTPPA